MTKGIFIPNMNKDKTTQYRNILSKHFFSIQYEKDYKSKNAVYSDFSSVASFLDILKAQSLILKSLSCLATAISTNVMLTLINNVCFLMFTFFIPSPDCTREHSLCNESIMIRNVCTTSRRHGVPGQALFSFIAGMTSTQLFHPFGKLLPVRSRSHKLQDSYLHILFFSSYTTVTF